MVGRLFGRRRTAGLVVTAISLFLPAAAYAASLDTSADAVMLSSSANGAFTSLTGPIIDNIDENDFSGNSGTITLTAPAGFEFDTGGTAPTVLVTCTNGCGGGASNNINGLTSGSTIATIVTTSSVTITITDDVDGGGTVRNSLTWQDLRVRPTAVAATSGDILIGGTVEISGGSVNDGSPVGTLEEMGLTEATGGSAIPNNTVGGAWTTLTGPVLFEIESGDIGDNGAGTIILNVPTGFEFDTGGIAPTVLVTRTGGSGSDSRNINDVPSGSSIAMTTITSTQLTFTVDHETSNGVTNSLTWQNIRVRPTAALPLASGNITKTGASVILGVTNSVTSFGTLTEVLAASTATTTTVTSDNDPSVYGEAVTLTATVTGSSPTGTVEFFDGAVSLGTGSVVAGQASIVLNTLSAGSHNITAEYAGDGGNDPSTSAIFVQDVDQAPLTIEATSTVKTYGDTVTFAGTEFGATGLLFSDSVTSVTLTSAGAAAGASVAGSPYNIVPSAAVGTGLSNYDITYVNGTLSINTAALGVVADAKSKNYGDADPAFTVVGTGFVNGEDESVLTGSMTRVVGENVGTYPISQGTLAAPANYTMSFTGSNLTINARPLEITADDKSRQYGTSNPTFTASFDSFGFADTVASLGGTLVFTTSATVASPVGTYAITPSGVTSTNYAITFTAGTLTIDTGTTATSTIVDTPTPNSTVGDSVQLDATVTGYNPTGDVYFYSGSTLLGSAAVSGGTASINHIFTVAGDYTINAEYQGDSNNDPSTGSTTVHVVDKDDADTVTTVSSSNPAIVGVNIDFTATVSGAYNPTGTVEFYDGATLLGSDTLDGSFQASFSTSSLTVGSHNITAHYLGDANNNASISGVETVLVQVIDKDSPDTVTTVSSSNPQTVGQNVTFTATVYGAFNPTGTVEFYDGATLMGTGSLNGSFEASFTTDGLSVGSHDITAHYLGDGNNNASVSGVETVLVQEIEKDNPTTSTVLSVSNPSTIGDNVTLTADVTGGFNPSGDVEFFANGVSLGTSPLVAGTATLVVNTLAVGSHDLDAEYLGDGNNNASTSPTVTIHVVQKQSSTSLFATVISPNSVHNGVSMTVDVTGYNPTGLVEFYADGILLGSAALDVNGRANIERFLAIGNHVLEAFYLGDLNNFDSSASSSVEIVEFLPGEQGDGGAPTSNGSARGSGGTNLSSLAAFAAGTYGFTGAPAAFGGDDAPLTDEDIGYICSMQRALGFASEDVINMVATVMSGFMGRSTEAIAALLIDPTLCSGINAALKPYQTTASATLTLFPVDRDGFPVSSNELWNSCLRGSVSLDQIRNNTDRNEYRRAGVSNPLTCGHYRTAGQWRHPDLGIYFSFDRATRQLTLPEGYLGILNEYASR